MTRPRSRSAPPRAAAMLEALRGLGYSPATALADIIDNSIAAGAATVDITFHWDGPDSHISVLDDGCGMTDAELEKAMRLGERNPLDDRAGSDLGRFGLGLKTASFSQARRLTVASCCVFHDDPDSDSANIRTPVPRTSGHRFHGHPDTHEGGGARQL